MARRETSNSQVRGTNASGARTSGCFQGTAFGGAQGTAQTPASARTGRPTTPSRPQSTTHTSETPRGTFTTHTTRPRRESSPRSSQPRDTQPPHTSTFAALPALLKAFIIVGAALVLITFARLFYLQIIKGGEYRDMAQATRTDVVSIAAVRGTIYDRRGNVLAISVPATTVYANPQEVKDPEATARVLAQTLDADEELILDNIIWGQENDKQFIYVKRQASLQEGSAVRALKLDGVYFLEDTRREYPYGQVAGQIVGLCNAEGSGVCGLELYYDKILAGVAGEFVAEIGESGLPIPGGLVQSKPAINGQDIMITIDIDMQKELEDALVRSASTEGASSTSGIIMDGSNGEILAMASLPLFNPADTSQVEDGATTLWPVSIYYEPGSTFKTISAVALLEHGAARPETQIFCPVALEANERTVTDSEERDPATMDLNRIMAISSNVGIVRLVEEHLGFDVLYKDIIRYGFTEKTGVDFPGETAGYLAPFSTWTPIQAYNVSFGQGVSVSGLQLVRFYGALANGGIACTPHFLLTNITTGTDATYPTRRLVNNPATAADIAGVLRHVITEGTAWTAKIPDYYVVGKSGTAEIFDGNEYRTDKFNRSFIGYLTDASTPLVVYFCAQEVAYEGSVAPVTFRAIMSAAIERYRVTTSWDGVETTVPGVQIAVE